MSSPAESPKRPVEDDAPDGTNRSISGKRSKGKGNAQPATKLMILELPKELAKDINGVLNEKQIGDRIKDRKDRFNRLKEVCGKLTRFDPSFRYSHFKIPDHEITNYISEEDRILVRELGQATYNAQVLVDSKGRGMALQAARGLVMADKSLDRDTRDPFDQNNPIKYKGKAIHEFNEEDLEKLSSDDAHEIIKLISKVVRHIAVGLTIVPKEVILSVSSGMGHVLSNLDHRKVEFSLSEKEVAYIIIARKKFMDWKGKLSKRS